MLKGWSVVYGRLKLAIPLTVGIQSKGNRAHATIGKLLLELVSCIFNPLTGSLNVVYTYAHMAKTLVRISVAICDFVVGIILGAVVVSELDDALTVGPMFTMGCAVGTIKGQKVQAELCIGVVNLVDQ